MSFHFRFHPSGASAGTPHSRQHRQASTINNTSLDGLVVKSIIVGCYCRCVGDSAARVHAELELEVGARYRGT
jgi:hypothetical protein